MLKTPYTRQVEETAKWALIVSNRHHTRNKAASLKNWLNSSNAVSFGLIRNEETLNHEEKEEPSEAWEHFLPFTTVFFRKRTR